MIDFANGKFSEKALDYIQNSNARLNIAHGSVRSTKTVNQTLRWITYCIDGPPGDLMMCGKTVATLKRNVLNDLIDIAGKQFRWVDRQQGEILLFGRRVYLVGASSEEAESKIRGSTLAGAYCDEVSLYPKSFVEMLMTRLSVPGAMAFLNCNPGDPDHWFYRDYIMNDKIKNKKIWHFTLDDNPNLTAEYREALEQTFQGVFYDRMIRGLWVVAEGIIYRRFADNVEKYLIDEIPKAPGSSVPDLAFSIVAIDFGGTTSGQAFNCTGYSKDFRKIYTLDDYWSDKEFDANQLAHEFVNFLRRQIAAGYRVTEIRADGEASVLVRTVRNLLRVKGINIPVKNAIKGPILDRIQFYGMLFGTNSYQIMRHCEHTIKAFKTARWHPKKVDVRLDDGSTNIDNIDAQEYTTEPFQKKMQDLILLVGGGVKNEYDYYDRQKLVV